jgi:hypothetical protein
MVSVGGTEMSIENLLSRLERVKSVGKHQFKACCPAHKDKSPSLAVRLLDDGRILIRCMAECPTDEVLDAIGLSMTDLFPEKLGDFKPEKRPFSSHLVLQLIASEATVVALCGSKLASHPLNDTDRTRLFLAVSRINSALAMAGLSHA